MNDVLGDPARLAALERSGLLDSPQEETFDRLTRMASRLLRAPIAVMSVVTADREFIKSQHGLVGALADQRQVPAESSWSQFVVRAGAALMVSDAGQHPVLAEHPALQEFGAVACAGVPLDDAAGYRLGSFCVMSTEPRAWSEDEISVLQELADLVMAELRLRSAIKALQDRTDQLESSQRRVALAAAEIDRTALALEEAQALSQVGSWEWDPRLDRMEWSREMCRMFGVPAGPSTLAEHEAKLGRSGQGDVRGHIAAALGGDGRWQVEHPAIGPDGRTRLVVSHGHALRGGDGEVALVRGTCHDVTEQRTHEARFRAAFADAPIGAALIGLAGPDRGRWLQANRELERMLGVVAGELDDVLVSHFLHPDDVDRNFVELDRLARGEVGRTQHEQRLRRVDSTHIWTMCTGAVVRAVAGEPDYAIAYYDDIGERKRHEAELEHLAHHDHLTGLFNRRRFSEEIERSLAHAARYARPGALLTFDLDRFKDVNDAAGHVAGDGVLVAVAQALRGVLRSTDVIARIGGDEFAILLPEAGISQSCQVAEKILTLVRRHGVVPGNPQSRLGVTASIGIATWTEAWRADATETLVRADVAMYSAKTSGGDRYAIYDPDEDPRHRPAV